MIDSLVVDANPLLSALLGGQARNALFSRKITFFASPHTLFEVEKYLPLVARKIGRAELVLLDIATADATWLAWSMARGRLPVRRDSGHDCGQLSAQFGDAQLVERRAFLQQSPAKTPSRKDSEEIRSLL